MKFVAILVSLILVSPAIAQHGMAERPGLYNFPYHGDTWTGTVSSLDPSTRHLTLSYSHRDKSESFTGVLQPEGAALEDEDGNAIANQPITIGQKLMVYYVEKGRKYFIWDDNKKKHEAKADENIIFKIRVFRPDKKHS